MKMKEEKMIEKREERRSSEGREKMMRGREKRRKKLRRINKRRQGWK